MSPYEVERLDWPDYRGIPIKADESVPTGRFRLICEGDHSDSSAPAIAEVAELPLHHEAEIVEPVAI